ncbi:BolA/IbaG family iron-sulfur metabolism protein [Pseudomaricurvus alkylphenolicus]|uniref:BolA family protein n=1 Tax=Pseudomaricurvus alkylphenolicus TaxID=1306991 RepID=UPI0014221B57|nr:BolA/IbaG family iron-sulfur metabolism protein [Pseudomaricurvus alkylphenolicus]NIB44018.1 BolA/IbaG family iron-sulfur metabolism protein [Pseudomaricurvus alkylphenolicus]
MTVQAAIEAKLQAEFSPLVLEVTNESHMHNVPPGSESHFKVVLVSKGFEGVRKVKRHQLVYGVLAEEMAGPIHALALHTYDEVEYQGQAPQSPQCLGGSKADV